MFQSQTIKFFFEQINRYKKETLWGTFLLVITNAIGILIPIQIKKTIDLFVEQGLTNGAVIWNALVIIAGLALLMAVVRIGSRIILFGVGRRIESDQKQEFFDHLLSLDILYFNSQRIGDLISRATNDIQAIRMMMGFGLLNIINIIWVYALTLPLMFSLSFSLTLWVIIGYIPVLFLVRIISLRLKTQQQIAQERLGSLSSFIEEDINGIQVIKAYSQEKREISRFKKINDEYLKISIELAQWRGIIWPTMELARGVSFFILLIYVSQGLLNAGTVVAFLVCLERILFPTAIIGWLITIFQRGSVSIDRIKEILSEKSKIVDRKTLDLEIDLKKGLQLSDGSIEVKNLTFSFKDDDKSNHDSTKALNNISLAIDGGQFVGVVGLIGSGKSTLCNAILRLLDIPDKSIFIDSEDICSKPITSLRQHVSLVPQESFLFNVSVKDNIGFSGDFTKEEITQAATDAHIHDEILNFSEGYDTVVGEKGVSLSGGQAQRIALARAIIRNPEILILDDSIASVDNEIGLKILKSIRKRFTNKTLILVTHRISSLKDSDEIFVLDKGQCVGQGKHSHLLRHNEIYQRLWKQQKTESAV
ncbi:MAG: ABC transporter ATP-binding protein [Candidatus Caenarcaniphilales bacterium]|nr:ABC transporter ATP-binding protein [Candidatus Caenarcaniphilales bacterium]